MARMTEQQMEEFANIVADKVFNLLLKKQGEFDQQFIDQIKASGKDIEVALQQDVFGNYRQVTNEEVLLSEIARLMTLLSAYEEKEQYEKAAIIKRKIEHLENKLKEL